MKTVKTSNDFQNKYRLWYFYAGFSATIFTIPVSSIYEAALVKHTLAFSDLVKYEQEVIPNYENAIGLEVYSKGEWVDWYDDDGNDNMEKWLKENEPENYTKIENLHKHFRAIRENGTDLTDEE